MSKRAASDPVTRKKKKARVEKTEEQMVEEYRAQMQKRHQTALAKNVNHAEWLVGKNALSAKHNSIGGHNMFICPVTRDASDIVYALSIKKDGTIKFKEGFTSMPVALRWLREFLHANFESFKHYHKSVEKAEKFYCDMVEKVFDLVPVKIKDFDGKLTVQKTNRSLYVDVA